MKHQPRAEGPRIQSPSVSFMPANPTNTGRRNMNDEIQNHARGKEGVLLTYDDLANRWQVPRSTLHWMVFQRRLPHLRLGPRTVRFDLQAIEEFERQHTVQRDETPEVQE